MKIIITIDIQDGKPPEVVIEKQGDFDIHEWERTYREDCLAFFKRHGAKPSDHLLRHMVGAGRLYSRNDKPPVPVGLDRKMKPPYPPFIHIAMMAADGKTEIRGLGNHSYQRLAAMIEKDRETWGMTE